MMEFGLSSRGLSNPSTKALEKDFTFVVGKNEYKVPSILADFVSPKVAMIHSSDPSVDTYTIYIDDMDNKFERVIKLMYGEQIEITDVEATYLKVIGAHLGNKELVCNMGCLSDTEPNIDSVFKRLKEKKELELQIDQEIEYIASHLYEINPKELYNIDQDTLYYILCSNYLQIENEDWLFHFIMKLIDEKGDEYKYMLNTVMFDLVSVEVMREFADKIVIDDVSGSMWDSLMNRMLLKVKPLTKKYERYHINGEDYPYERGDPFNGILNSLNQKCKGNAHSHGLVSITASSSGGWNGQPCQTIDYGWTGAWGTQNFRNSWIRFDFKEKLVILTGYSIRSHNWGVNSFHMKSFAIEGSLDGLKWNPIDEKFDINELNGALQFYTWKCKKSLPYRYVQIRQIGKNQAGNNHLALHEIELFGTIFRP